MKIHLTLICATLGSFFLIQIKPAFAQTPVVHISPIPTWILPAKPYDKKPSARNIENGAYDELIEEQVNVEKQATYNHTITQIISQSGVQNESDISVSFDPSYQQLDFHSIVIWRNGKAQNRLDVSAFKLLADEEEFEKFLYNGTYSAKYILSDVRKGDKIEYAYTITGSNPIFFNKFCKSIYFQGSRLIAHVYTTLLFSTSRKMNIKLFNSLSQPKISTKGDMKHYEWEDFQVPGTVTNKYEPQWVNDYARAQVSDYQSWADVVNWGLKINPLQTTFAGELADSVAQLKKRAGGDKEKYFRAAVTLVQDEVRYMGVETGAYSNKANAPNKVFKQRYGDCKDKSLLLASILNSGGIEAHLVLINTDIKEKLVNYIPSTALFDHMTVVANVNGKQVYVDATIAYQRGKGTDLYYPPYREGLILKAGNNALTEIDESKYGKIICQEKFNITDEKAPVKFKVTTVYTLNQADGIRDQIASTGLAKMEKNYLDYYSKTFNKIEASDSIIVKDNEEKNELTTIESYTIKDFFKRDSVDDNYSGEFYADNIAGELPNIPAQIKTPVSVTYPYSVDFTTLAIFPNTWNVTEKHFTINRDAYKFSFDKTASQDTLSLHYQFAFLKDYVTADHLTEFRDDIKKLKDEELFFKFSYTPYSTKTPFEVNNILAGISLLITGLCVFVGIKIYTRETATPELYNEGYAFPPLLGGWLILLLLLFIGGPLFSLIRLLTDNSFSMHQWNLVPKNISNTANRLYLIFGVSGRVAFTCFAAFCFFLIINRRDIAPRFIKLYFISSVIFVLLDCVIKALAKDVFSSQYITQVISKVIFAAIWTYYLNMSVRVKETFVVPYPD